jgi:hypothetical protein
MTFEPPQRREQCITDLKFDAWFAGELSAPTRSAIDEHLADCPRCQVRRAELEGERQAFLRMRPHAPVQTRAAGRRRSRFVLGSALLGAAAIVMLALRSNTPDAVAPLRAKGGPHLGFFVQRGEHAARGTPGQVVHPGDSIRFVYTSERAVYLAIYARDAAGVVSVYYPAQSEAQPVPGGHDALLDSAVRLDSVLGRETVFGVFCADSFALDAPKAALAGGRGLEPAPGCSVDALSWMKERMP